MMVLLLSEFPKDSLADFAAMALDSRLLDHNRAL
jgi:hypothetical protein